jgi:glycosyltransferase involved in cell wall biosynthesis
MPVYNEEECVKEVVLEWLTALRNQPVLFKLCVMNDGSKDATLTILNTLAHTNPELLIVDKANSGHGQTCIEGYKLGLQQGAEWIFQIDSDGQCDPHYFSEAIALSQKHKVVYGFRKTRDDGFKRYLISRVLSIFTFAATGVWVRDANVPYRLMHKTALDNIVNKVPADFYLSNILISVLQQREFGIKWINIHFRDRSGGSPSVKAISFVKHGLKVFKQLKQAV